MKTETTTLPGFYIAGLQVRTTNANAQAATDIGGLWQAFMQGDVALQINNKIGTELYCVYTDYESDHTGHYTAILGCKVSAIDNLPDGVAGITIPESNYTVFTPEGSGPAAIGEAWQQIWQTDINRKYTADFDVYDVEGKAFDEIKTRIYIAVE